VKLSNHSDRHAAAAIARGYARELGLSERESHEVALCVAELASNAVRHAGGGELRLHSVDDPFPALAVVVSDRGPGLDPHHALTSPEAPRLPGESLRSGLAAVRRLMTNVDVRSRPGGGTEIVALKRIK
jgi:serine/threonine-protein kinase RsbT